MDAARAGAVSARNRSNRPGQHSAVAAATPGVRLEPRRPRFCELDQRCAGCRKDKTGAVRRTAAPVFPVFPTQQVRETPSIPRATAQGAGPKGEPRTTLTHARTVQPWEVTTNCSHSEASLARRATKKAMDTLQAWRRAHLACCTDSSGCLSATSAAPNPRGLPCPRLLPRLLQEAPTIILIRV